MKKICIVVSSPLTIKAFLLKHIEALASEYSVSVVVNAHMDLLSEYGIKVESKYINIERNISILKDIQSIYQLFLYLKKEQFDMVLSVTPKAGLVASISSYFAGIKVRSHFFTGQVWATKRGFIRVVLKNVDRLIAMLETNIYVDSFSQKEFLVEQNIINSSKSTVLLSGSISGVDIDKFSFNQEIKDKLIQKYNIQKDELVFMFLGRLNHDKGIFDLYQAFKILLKKYKNIKLFLVGPDEENIEKKIDDLLNSKQVIRIGYVKNPQEILNIADILVLPSYREGFGTIVIEAAAMGIPTIGSNIYGLKDAILDGKTGLLHEKKSVDDMIKKYKKVIEDRKLLQTLGKNAKDRVYSEFIDTKLSEALKKSIDSLVQ